MLPQKIKVVIADDHVLFRQGLRMLLHTDNEIEVVAEAGDGIELLALVKEHNPDVILTDLVMPGGSGVKAIKELSGLGIKRTIALSSFDSEHLIVEAIEAGALSYVIKSASQEEIIEAVKASYECISYYCSSTSPRIMRLLGKSRTNSGNTYYPGLFTWKEKEIICLICDGKSTEEIAKIVLMSKRSVDRMRAEILQKMNVRNAVGIVVFAIRNAIYFLDDK
jgi:DNA-binding NarL/FixJ family response regulator